MEALKNKIQKRDSEAVDTVERTRSGKVFVPAVDILDSDDHLTLYADMPGCEKTSIDITLENDVLSIQGNICWQPPKDYELVYNEYEVGDYRRAFTLDESINREKIEADYNNGVLRLTLPKLEPAKPKKIAVKFS